MTSLRQLAQQSLKDKAETGYCDQDRLTQEMLELMWERVVRIEDRLTPATKHYATTTRTAIEAGETTKD